MPNNNQEIIFHQRSQIDEVIGKPPHWLVRRGTLILLFLFILILSFSLWIYYPEIIKVNFIIADSKSHETAETLAKKSKFQYIIVTAQMSDSGKNLISAGQKIKVHMDGTDSTYLIQGEIVNTKYQNSQKKVMFTLLLPIDATYEAFLQKPGESGYFQLVIKNKRLLYKIFDHRK